MQRVLLSCWWVAVLLLVFSPARAVEWTLHGVVKNETAYFFSGENRLDKIQNRLDLKPEAVLTDRLEFRGRLLAWYDAAMDIEATNATDLSPSIKNHYRNYARAKEAYLLYGGDDFDLRIGQQQIVWGKTDGLRLLDIVNPLDLREFILDDFLDSRIGVVAARLNYYSYIGGREHEFEFLVIPDAKVAELAPFGSRWDFELSTIPTGITPVIRSGDEPNWAAKNSEYGAAWRANIDGWDLSLNWFYGWNDIPNIQQQLVGTTLFITPVYSRMHTVGGAFSNAFGALVIRGEMAVNINEGINKIGTTAATSIGKDTTWNAAFGLDYTKNNWFISSQLFVRYLPGWDLNTVEDQASGFVSLLLSTDYMNEKLKPEMIGIYSWSDRSWWVSPKLSYEFSDEITARVGADLFGGEISSFFGQVADNDRLYTEVEYHF